jgi:hypothetical protein
MWHGVGVRQEPLRSIGWWRGWPVPAGWPEDVPADLRSDFDPDARDFIDPDWDPAERSRVAKYLESGYVYAVCVGGEPCPICGRYLWQNSATDGTFEWPTGLAHFVAEHSVRLPNEVVRHIVAQRSPPQLDDADIEERTADITWWRIATIG